MASEWCDKAKAFLNINQACGITRNLRRFADSLPVQSTQLDSAITSIDSALNAGPNTARNLNAAILGTAQGVQNLITANERLLLSPLTQAHNTVRDGQRQIDEISRGLLGVMDSMNCVSEMLTGSAIPGMSRARSCVRDAQNKIDAELNAISSTIGLWENETKKAIDDRLKDLNKRIGSAIRDFEDDHEVVACLSSTLGIGDNIFTRVNSELGTTTSNVGAIGAQAGGCSGMARNVSDLMNKGVQELNESLQRALELNDQTNTAVLNLSSYAATLPSAETQAILEALSTVSVPPFTEATQTAVSSVATSMTAVSNTMQQAAQQASITQIAFTFGHEIFLDRVNDIIRIRHRDKYTLLFDNSNIIAATEVTNKKVAWIENLMAKYNVHVHGTSPPPTPLLTLQDGTTIFKAG